MSGLGGSRVWRRAVKRAGHSKYWQTAAGLNPRSYRSPSAWWDAQKISLIDTHALLLTEVGEVIVAVVSVIFPPVGLALTAATVAMTHEEKRVLAHELLRAEMRACALDVDQCAETEESLWFAEYETGTTMTPGGAGEGLTPQAANILRLFLEDGGDERQVVAFLMEVEKRQRRGKFDAAAAGTG